MLVARYLSQQGLMSNAQHYSSEVATLRISRRLMHAA
jgi:hypothetical protein